MTNLSFRKMHGLGNDFLVIDARTRRVDLAPTVVRALADRRTGVGFDQMITVLPPSDGAAAAALRIHNADGGEVQACGNASRCVADLVMRETGRADVVLETAAGLLPATAAGAGFVTVDMGPARTDWREIPLAEPCDTLHVGIEAGPLRDPVAVSIGNPHAVFFTDNAAAIDLEAVGPAVEHHPAFPERTNVEAAEVLDRGRLRLRVWERGVGLTRACGTGACAAVVAAHRRGLTERIVDVELDGGELAIVWRADGHVLMTGPVATSFVGTLDSAWLNGEAGT